MLELWVRTEIAWYEWNWSHTVNVWDHPNGTNIDCFSIGDYSKNSVEFSEVLEGIEQYEADIGGEE